MSFPGVAEPTAAGLACFDPLIQSVEKWGPCGQAVGARAEGARAGEVVAQRQTRAEPTAVPPFRESGAGGRGVLQAGRLDKPFLVLHEDTWEVAAGGRGCRNLGASSKASGSAADRVPGCAATCRARRGAPGEGCGVGHRRWTRPVPACVCSSVLGRSGQEAPGQPLAWARCRWCPQAAGTRQGAGWASGCGQASLRALPKDLASAPQV